jgi:hypothetical protein
LHLTIAARQVGHWRACAPAVDALCRHVPTGSSLTVSRLRCLQAAVPELGDECLRLVDSDSVPWLDGIMP